MIHRRTLGLAAHGESAVDQVNIDFGLLDMVERLPEGVGLSAAPIDRAKIADDVQQSAFLRVVLEDRLRFLQAAREIDVPSRNLLVGQIGLQLLDGAGIEAIVFARSGEVAEL